MSTIRDNLQSYIEQWRYNARGLGMTHGQGRSQADKSHPFHVTRNKEVVLHIAEKCNPKCPFSTRIETDEARRHPSTCQGESVVNEHVVRFWSSTLRTSSPFTLKGLGIMLGSQNRTFFSRIIEKEEERIVVQYCQ